MAGERGAADAERDIRGSALKFYTDEGNWDMVGNNTPVFFIRDPRQFPDLYKAVKRDPRTNLRSATYNWDYWTLLPEALHQVTIVMSDRGLPASYRHMHGFSSHTYSFWNAQGERFWVKMHFRTQQGIKNLSDVEAEALAEQKPGKLLRRRRAGRLRAEQPGARHRREPRPHAAGAAVQLRRRAALPPGRQLPPDPSQPGALHYEPNSFGQWQAQPQFEEPPLRINGDARHRSYHADDANYFEQPRKLFQLMTDAQQEVLFGNTARARGDAPEFVKYRHIRNCHAADPAYGAGVAKALGLDLQKALASRKDDPMNGNQLVALPA